MKIVFYGSSILSSYWNGAATYYRGLLRSMAARGHEIVFCEPDAYGRQENRDINPPSWANVHVWSADDAGLAGALDLARGADVVVKASGVGVFDAELERMVLERADPRALVVYWDVDAPATLDRLAMDPNDPLRQLLPRYDMVLTYGGGQPVIDKFTGLGARYCEPVYNALDPEEHFPVPPDPRFECDLAFVGNRLPDREARVEEFFLNPAAALAEQRFLLGGSGWEDRELPSSIRLLGHVSTRDHNPLNATALAVLNVTRESMARNGWSPPTRLFEVAGAGGCLITDQWQGIELFLKPDEEVLVARDGNDVAEHLRALDHGRATRIGQQALARIRSEHTYERRAQQVDRLLSTARSAKLERRVAS